MKAFFDTSVLVPIFLADHPHHDASIGLFTKSRGGQSSCAAHTLAELYSTLTRMPPKYRATPEHAMLFLGEVRDRLQVVALSDDEYYVAIQQASTAGIMGGAIYDALLAACATKAKADVIYTWNVDHFTPAVFAGRVRTP